MENNKIVNNSTPSTSSNEEVTTNQASIYLNTISSENEVNLPKTGEHRFYKFGILLSLFLGFVYVKFKYLHT